MEEPMSNGTIKHEIKLPKYLIVLLAAMVIGLFANAFSPVFNIKEAKAELSPVDYVMFRNEFKKITSAINNIAACRK